MSLLKVVSLFNQLSEFWLARVSSCLKPQTKGCIVPSHQGRQS